MLWIKARGPSKSGVLSAASPASPALTGFDRGRGRSGPRRPPEVGGAHRMALDQRQGNPRRRGRRARHLSLGGWPGLARCRRRAAGTQRRGAGTRRAAAMTDALSQKIRARLAPAKLHELERSWAAVQEQGYGRPSRRYSGEGYTSATSPPTTSACRRRCSATCGPPRGQLQRRHAPNSADYAYPDGDGMRGWRERWAD